jgi:hypothetical protein
MSLASGVVLSMDQATFENQIVLWDFAECREDSGLDCNLHLCAGGYHSQGTEGGAFAARNPANTERHPFGENPYLWSLEHDYRALARTARGNSP